MIANSDAQANVVWLKVAKVLYSNLSKDEVSKVGLLPELPWKQLLFHSYLQKKSVLTITPLDRYLTILWRTKDVEHQARARYPGAPSIRIQFRVGEGGERME